MDDQPEKRRSRDSGAAYRALVEHAVYGILRADRDGAFIAVNPALAELLAYESAEELAEATSLPGLAAPSEHERMLERFGATGRVRGFETEWRRKDGSSVAIRLSGRLLYDDFDTLDGFELMVEDVSERARLEAQLRQAQKMEAIGQLTGGIAHDFNNLLTVIVATADLLAEPIEQLQPEYKIDLDNLRSAAKRGSEMARKLLGFSRRGALSLDFVDLGKVTLTACGMLRPLLPENIEMRVERDETLGPVRADAGAVEQVLMNLVTNARDAMPDGGTLRIEVRRSVLDDAHRRTRGWGDPGEYAMIAVSDSGVGMDETTRRRMFEPFFTTKALGAGTGLGMPMVFGLVKQHGGFIDVVSEPGKGTTVLTYFPIAGAGASLEKRPSDVSAPRGTESVLIAEDEDGVRRLARRSLEGLGYRVTAASTGEEALELLSADPPRYDLVLTDVGMPRLSGPDFYKAARAADISTPFIFMSAYNADDLRASNKLPPALPFLHKPWTMPDLARRVRDVLDTINARSVLKGRSVLVADGDSTSRHVVRARLEEAGAVVIEAPDADTALRQYRSAPADLVVTDPVMPDLAAQGFIAELRRERPDVRVLAISGAAAVTTEGYTRSLTKPFTSAQLLDAAAGALQTEDD